MQSSTSRRLGVRHQVGLKAVRVSHRHAASVNVHDPVAGKYHRLREDEYFFLCRLDGNVSLDELRDEYQRRYPNRRITPAQINALLFRFHESGLTISHAPGQGATLLLRLDQERRKRWLAAVSQWLFIRFPGVDPAPVMRWLVPLTNPLLSRIGVVTGFIFVAASFVLMLVQYDRFVSELPSAGEWLTMQNALILAGIIALTKIAHELGHAAVSERFGARSRSIGLMLLVFTPALYCDTSQSWMLASRWRRAAVALAGIATELLIASVCVWVWFASSPGLVHTIASHVIVVCGISTVFFNANPLLRYDGYYLLSDLTDVPNLGVRANRRLTGCLRRTCLGVTDDQPVIERVDRSMWLLVYGVAAVAYRWLLMFAIITFVWMALRPCGLEILGQIAAVAAVACMLAAAVVPLRKFLSNPSNRRKIRMSRLMLTTGVAACLIAFGFIELPRNVVALARMVPEEETRVYVVSGGELAELHVCPGQRVEQGDLLARLENPTFEQQLIDAEGRLEQQTRRIESLRQSQTLVPEAAEHLAAANESLAQLRDEVATIEKKQVALSITAPRSGVVIAAAGNRDAIGTGTMDLDGDSLEPDVEHLPTTARTGVRLASWSGKPTDPENLRCVFTPGTELLSIADPNDWVAEVAVDAAEADRIDVGSPAVVIWDAAPTERFTGKVVEISEETFEPQVDSVRRDHPDAARTRWTPETRYLVSIAIENASHSENSESGRAAPTWLVGGSGRVKIPVAPQSLWQRVAECFAGVFRFR
ncbi:HlyD family efflux transporter periplasmic adaptor subunit [Aporhodopirellula aestuarii]|uniref:HlyD family efflux transporter periplasmic adaptor subunit n=1 Tax=Aporhodopirellula aestuarii TaxID=2950107 RepID=A0ABT0TXU2_9BACT|nr:HlyD family efflux transporter periplasmic adaptor subunit [Aporhodopirellula aestuarii]MCM2369422.1 HlyD family efflux transporter periplasmic adaptor subunit [Aporhodopirellula aestuarii]